MVETFKGKPARILDRAFDETRVTGITKLVFLTMCRRGNRSGMCFMAVGRIVSEAGVSESTVKRILKELAAKRLVEPVATSTDCYRPRRYRLYPQEGAPEPHSRSERAFNGVLTGPRNLKQNPKKNLDACVRPRTQGSSVRTIGSIAAGLIEQHAELRDLPSE